MVDTPNNLISGEEVVLKSAKQLQKEARKTAKLEKFKQKKEKKETNEQTKAKEKDKVSFWYCSLLL